MLGCYCIAIYFVYYYWWFYNLLCSSYFFKVRSSSRLNISFRTWSSECLLIFLAKASMHLKTGLLSSVLRCSFSGISFEIILSNICDWLIQYSRDCASLSLSIFGVGSRFKLPIMWNDRYDSNSNWCYFWFSYTLHFLFSMIACRECAHKLWELCFGSL